MTNDSKPIPSLCCPLVSKFGCKTRRECQIIGVAKQPRSYLVKSEMSTHSLKPTVPSNSPTMAPRDQAVPVPQTPPNVSTQDPENLPAESSTPTKPTTVMPAQESHPNTENSSAHLPVSGRLGPTERVTRSGRVVKAPQRLDL